MNELAEVKNTKLVEIIEESKLDKTKSQVLLDNFSNYFQLAADWESKTKDLVITSVDQKAEMKMAREARLFLRQKRLDVEKTRKQLKESSLRESQTIDAIAKILTNLIIPIEESLEQKEKFAEIQEANGLLALEDVRSKDVAPYAEFVPHGIKLSSMADAQYEIFLTGLKIQFDHKVAMEKKAEDERVAKEKADREERARIEAENERLKKEAAEREALLAKERAEAEAKRKEAERIANEKLKAERAKSEAERLKAEAEARKAQQEKDAALAKERAEKEAERLKAIEAERALQAKIKAEQEEKERIAKIEADKKAKEEEEERKRKAAPDKEKILAYLWSIDSLVPPEISDSHLAELFVPFTIKLKAATIKLLEVINEQ